ncbi:hypothetical protein H4R99_001175 [Coemansia sp. RSA 1722]|nr:hypothetical protein H4R99_001175 [Coemansia sp. RSA 1722]
MVSLPNTSTPRFSWLFALVIFYIHAYGVFALQLATIFTYHQYSTTYANGLGNASNYLKALRYVNIAFALIALLSRSLVFQKSTYVMQPQHFIGHMFRDDIFLCAVSMGIFMDPVTQQVFDDKKGFLSAWKAYQICIATMIVTLVAFVCSLAVFITRIMYDKHIIKEGFVSDEELHMEKAEEIARTVETEKTEKGE